MNNNYIQGIFFGHMLLQETLPAVFSTLTRTVIIFIQLIYIHAIATFDIVSHCSSQTS